MGEIFFKLSFFTILILFVSGGILDAFLWLRDQPTISKWLTENMHWFYWPAAAMLCFIGGMYVHLRAMQ